MSKRPVAFAIKDQSQRGSAPTIVAKGHGAIAENILRLAFDNDVKVRTDKDLTEILSVVEVDCGIPLEAFAAVAEILSYVYNANSKIKDCKKSDGDDA
jgi:flagellar biosynthesis protein